MRLVTELREVVAFQNPLILTFGNFDGIHLGHQRLLEAVMDRAHKTGGLAAAFTFREHPQSVLQPNRPPELLMSPEQKIFLFEKMGLDTCLVIPFTIEFSRQAAPQFVEQILVGTLKAKEIFLGSSARFGEGRKGDAALMKSLSSPLGFRFEEVPPVIVGGETVSSSKIRQFVKAADFEKARQGLGHDYSLFCRVVRGAGRGKALGYPTANLEIGKTLFPPQGVYAVSVCIMKKKGNSLAEDGRFRGVLNYGTRPTFGGESAAVAEVHLLGFQGELYGETLDIAFQCRIRPEKTFSGPEELRRQIQEDIQAAQAYWSRGKKAFTKRDK